jgi:hypothetical protein
MSALERIARVIYLMKPRSDGLDIVTDEPWRSCIPCAQAVLDELSVPWWKRVWIELSGDD